MKGLIALPVQLADTVPLVGPRASVPVTVLWDDTQRPGQLLDRVRSIAFHVMQVATVLLVGPRASALVLVLWDDTQRSA